MTGVTVVTVTRGRAEMLRRAMASVDRQVKSRFVENKLVDAASISVETMKGTVMLSGFAKNGANPVGQSPQIKLIGALR